MLEQLKFSSEPEGIDSHESIVTPRQRSALLRAQMLDDMLTSREGRPSCALGDKQRSRSVSPTDLSTLSIQVASTSDEMVASVEDLLLGLSTSTSADLHRTSLDEMDRVISNIQKWKASRSDIFLATESAIMENDDMVSHPVWVDTDHQIRPETDVTESGFDKSETVATDSYNLEFKKFPLSANGLKSRSHRRNETLLREMLDLDLPSRTRDLILEAYSSPPRASDCNECDSSERVDTVDVEIEDEKMPLTGRLADERTIQSLRTLIHSPVDKVGSTVVTGADSGIVMAESESVLTSLRALSHQLQQSCEATEGIQGVSAETQCRRLFHPTSFNGPILSARGCGRPRSREDAAPCSESSEADTGETGETDRAFSFHTESAFLQIESEVHSHLKSHMHELEYKMR